MAEQRGVRRRRLAVRPARPAGAARARRGTGARGRGGPGRQPRVLRAAARRPLGSVGGAARRRGDGGAGASTTSRASGTGSASRRTASWPSWRRPSARTRVAATRRACRCAATARTSRTGARWPTPRRSDDFDRLRRGVGARPDDARGLSAAGRARTSCSGSRADRTPCRGRPTPTPTPIVEDPAFTPWEQAASLGAREVERVVAEVDADAVLAGAGVANLAAWVAVARARAAGSSVVLTAELGLWGYEPTPADPYIFNQRVFPATPYLSDASSVLGMVIGGPGDDHRRVPGRGRGRPQRLPELDRVGGRALPRRLGRRQRRGQPGHGVRRGHAGPTRTAARDRGLRHVAGPARGQRGHRQGRPAPARRGAARGGRARGRGRSVEDRVRAFACVVRLRARGGAPGRGACRRCAQTRSAPCESSTARGCFWR